MNLSKNENKLLTEVNNEMYISELSKVCNITQSNAVVVCHKLVDKSLVFFKRIKNKKYVMLTEKGQDVKELLLKINMRG